MNAIRTTPFLESAVLHWDSKGVSPWEKLQVATPSKATEARRRLIIALLGSGASRRQAAAVAGIHHSQISRWVERGRRTPEGMFARFATEVERAEAHPALSALPELPEPTSAAELRWALRIAEREWREEASPQPKIVAVRLHDGTPIPGPEEGD